MQIQQSRFSHIQTSVPRGMFNNHIRHAYMSQQLSVKDIVNMSAEITLSSVKIYEKVNKLKEYYKHQIF